MLKRTERLYQPLLFLRSICLLYTLQSTVTSHANVLQSMSGAAARFSEPLQQNIAFRHSTNPGVTGTSRIKPPSDISSIIGKRNTVAHRNDKPEESFCAEDSQYPGCDERMLSVGDGQPKKSNRGSYSDTRLHHSVLAPKDINCQSLHASALMNTMKSPSNVQIQKKLFAPTDENARSGMRQSASFSVSAKSQTVSVARFAENSRLDSNRRKRVDESGSDDFTASAVDIETPVTRSREIGEHQPPTTARTNTVGVYRAIDESFSAGPVGVNISKVAGNAWDPRQFSPTKLNIADVREMQGSIFNIPLKSQIELTSRERKDGTLDQEAYEVLYEARNELHNMKEKWKEAVLASQSIAKIKLELSAAKDSAKEVSNLRQALAQACEDKENLTVELRKVAAQYDLLSRQLHDSDIRYHELEDSRKKLYEQHNTVKVELEALRLVEASRMDTNDDVPEAALARVRSVENQLRALECELSTVRAERDDFRMECEDLRRFADTLQIAATDAEQVTRLQSNPKVVRP